LKKAPTRKVKLKQWFATIPKMQMACSTSKP
jgi:hypothetical protein